MLLEYEIHRPLYDWMVRQAGFEHPPRQIEFARLNLTRTVMSKRHLRRLVRRATFPVGMIPACPPSQPAGAIRLRPLRISWPVG